MSRFDGDIVPFRFDNKRSKTDERLQQKLNTK
jgi:hypothetical protein